MADRSACREAGTGRCNRKKKECVFTAAAGSAAQGRSQEFSRAWRKLQPLACRTFFEVFEIRRNKTPPEGGWDRETGEHRRRVDDLPSFPSKSKRRSAPPLNLMESPPLTVRCRSRQERENSGLRDFHQTAVTRKGCRTANGPMQYQLPVCLNSIAPF